MQRKAGTDEPDLFETKLRVAEPQFQHSGRRVRREQEEATT